MPDWPRTCDDPSAFGVLGLQLCASMLRLTVTIDQGILILKVSHYLPEVQIPLCIPHFIWQPYTAIPNHPVNRGFWTSAQHRTFRVNQDSHRQMGVTGHPLKEKPGN